MAEHKEQPEKRKLWSHPMANVIVGFLLTGVVGTALTQYFFDRRQDEQLRAQQAQGRQDALDIAVQLTGESQIRNELLAEALLNNESREKIDELKQKQEDAVIEWRKEVPRLMLLARDQLSESEYEQFRANVETRLKEGRLDPLRHCLNKAYALAGDVTQVRQTLEQCRFDEQLKEVAVCAEAILGSLYEFTAADGDVSREIDDARRKELREEVRKACS